MLLFFFDLFLIWADYNSNYCSIYLFVCLQRAYWQLYAIPRKLHGKVSEAQVLGSSLDDWYSVFAVHTFLFILFCLFTMDLFFLLYSSCILYKANQLRGNCPSLENTRLSRAVCRLQEITEVLGGSQLLAALTTFSFEMIMVNGLKKNILSLSSCDKLEFSFSFYVVQILIS